MSCQIWFYDKWLNIITEKVITEEVSLSPCCLYDAVKTLNDDGHSKRFPEKTPYVNYHPNWSTRADMEISFRKLDCITNATSHRFDRKK